MTISYNIHSQSQQELISKLVEIPALLAHIFQTVESKGRAWRYFRVFNVILSYINSKVIYPTREQLAKAAGCSVETVSEATKYLKEIGFLRDVKHRHNSSNIYYISYVFYHPGVRKYLSRLFPACAMFLKWDFEVRVSATGAVRQRTGILLYIEDYSYIKKTKKKRLSCIITPSALGRASSCETGEAASWGRVSAPLGSAASEPPYDYYYSSNQPPTSGSQLVKGDGMRMIIAKVADMVPLADEQIAQLDVYTDAAIQHALNKLKRAKSVRDPAAYFMYILRSDAGLEHQGPSIRQQLASSQTKDQDSHKREAKGALSSAERYQQQVANDQSQPKETKEQAYVRLTNELAGWKKAIESPYHISSHMPNFMLTYAQRRCIERIENELSEMSGKDI